MYLQIVAYYQDINICSKDDMENNGTEEPYHEAIEMFQKLSSQKTLQQKISVLLGTARNIQKCINDFWKCETQEDLMMYV
jgi:hypothetical protein